MTTENKITVNGCVRSVSTSTTGHSIKVTMSNGYAFCAPNNQPTRPGDHITATLIPYPGAYTEEEKPVM